MHSPHESENRYDITIITTLHADIMKHNQFNLAPKNLQNIQYCTKIMQTNFDAFCNFLTKFDEI